MSENERIQFDVLARAWEFDAYRGWENSRSDIAEIDPAVTPDLVDSFIRDAATMLHTNPGLLEWYRQYQQEFRVLGRYGLFETLIDTELSHLNQEGAP